MNIIKTKKLNYILVAFIILSSTFLFNNKTIEKEKTTNNNLKALDQEGQNYRLVTSADNVQVPVPKGYVASNITGENYVTPEYSHTTNTYKVTSTELTWSSPAGEQYPWTQDSNGIWISGNQGIPSSTSTLESEEFNYIKGTILTINYTYSCDRYDFLDIYLINITNNTTQKIVDYKYGNTSNTFDYTTSNYTWTMNDWATGRYEIRAIYSKDFSGDAGQDSAYIKVSTYFKEDENGTETIEEDIKTKIHDGGFVIYQLTDEEIETDLNGTSVIINDINKYEAQSTRNQYVWVPVPNIEDIVRTKTSNNGIMQFGQGHFFRNKTITKEATTSEPRLVREDNTKYYFQRYSNMKTRTDYLNKMQEDFTRMIKSINKYKGFYIGRYETGDDDTHNNNSNKGCYINPRVVRYNRNIEYVSWYDSYKDLERLSGKTEEYVETGMIFDSLWDYTLVWLNETDTKNYDEIAEDSGTWGNYSNNTKTVQSGSTSLAKTGEIETISYKGGIYSDSPTSSNNIFDIAGNVDEWTMSYRYDGGRYIRGGDYEDDSDWRAAYYNFHFSSNSIRNDCGSRANLFIR